MSRGMGITSPMFFVGVVENRDDPTFQGRIKVRAFGVHGENTEEEIPTAALPWAVMVNGDYSSSNTPPPLNSFVFGMFMDGEQAQHPIILGSIPSQYAEPHDPEKDKWGVVPPENGDLNAIGLDPESFGMTQMSRLARAEDLDATYVVPQYSNAIQDQKIADSDKTWSEPPPAYGAKYPYNRVIETGRHSIEIDDTPGAERINIHHFSGSYIEIDAIGSVKERADGDRYEINIGTKHESSGHSVVTINGNSHVYIKGSKTEEIMGDLKQIVHGEHELSVGGSSFYNVGSHLNMRGANAKIEGNADRVTIFGKNEVQIEAEKQVNTVSGSIKNTAMTTFSAYGNKAVRLTTPQDMHFYAIGSIINTALGTAPTSLTPVAGSTGSQTSRGFSVTAPTVNMLSASGSFSGIWNAGTGNFGIMTATTTNTPTLNAGAITASAGNFTVLSAPPPISSAPGSPCKPGPGRLISLPSVPTIPTLPILNPPGISIPTPAIDPLTISGVAYPSGNGPGFLATVLTSPLAAIGFDINVLPGGGLGIPRIQMPEPASYSKTIVPGGYLSLGYAIGFSAPLDDSADGDFDG